MHIVLIIRRFYPLLLGGAEIRMKQVAEALIPRGYKFTVLTRRLKPDLPYHDSVSGIEIYRFPKSRRLFRLYAKKWLKGNQQSIDIIHTFRFDIVGIVGAWCHDKYQIPHIADTITNEIAKMVLNKRSFKYYKFKKIARGSDLIHCLNQYTANLLRQNGIPQEKIWYRPNAVNTELFWPEPTIDSREDQEVTFLYCGRLEKQKGTDTLISAWKMIPTELRSNARLILAGTGDEGEKNFRKQAEDFPEIRFVGWINREQMPEYYRKVQVYVHPSKYEGLSNSILEAMASGLPIITTNVAGNSELVTPGVNGILVPWENPSELASAMTCLIQNYELRRKMGINSRKLVETQYSMSALFNDYDKAYMKLFKAKQRGF